MAITKEQISRFYYISDAIKELVNVHYPSKPNKPRLIGSDSKAHLDLYENDMAIYQTELVEYRKLLSEFDAAAYSKMNLMLEEMIEEALKNIKPIN